MHKQYFKYMALENETSYFVSWAGACDLMAVIQVNDDQNIGNHNKFISTVFNEIFCLGLLSLTLAI